MYRPGPDSAFRRASPLTRLAVFAALAAMLPLWPATVHIGMIVVVLAGAAWLGLGLPVLRRLAILLAPVTIALLTIHGFFIPRGPGSLLGPATVYRDGVMYALEVLARLGLLLVSSLVFVMTTRPSDMARALDGAGVPPAASFLLTAPLALIETVASEAAQIRDSLHLRGLSGRGPVRARVMTLAAMVTPLVRGLIADAPVRAEALEMRGFRAGRRRGLLDPSPVNVTERRLRALFLGLAVLQLVLLAR